MAQGIGIMHRIGLLLKFGIDLTIGKLKPSSPLSINNHIQSAKNISIICPPGQKVIQHSKQIGELISLFSGKKVHIFHYNPELSAKENLFDPPLPSINLTSLSFWDALNTPALASIKEIQCDLLMNIDPDDRPIYHYIQKRLRPAFTISISVKNENRDANFVFNIKSEQLGVSLQNFCNFLKSLLS